MKTHTPSSIEVARAKVLLHQSMFRDDFVEWLDQNYQVFAYFEECAFKTWSAGFKHYSARTIVEVMRHRTNIREIGDGTWKLNNNRTPCMAKLYMLLHPEQRGFFELRERRKAA